MDDDGSVNRTGCIRLLACTLPVDSVASGQQRRQPRGLDGGLAPERESISPSESFSTKEVMDSYSLVRLHVGKTSPEHVVQA
jgi:hypothetical protein